MPTRQTDDSPRHPGTSGRADSSRQARRSRRAEPSPSDPRRRARRRAALAVAATLAVAAAAAGLFLLTREAPPGPDPDRVAELKASEEARRVEQIGDLIDQTRAAKKDLLPVVEGLDTVLPSDGSQVGDPPSEKEVASWESTVRDVAEDFRTAPSGDTGHNVARGGLRSAVELLDSSLVAYGSARDAEGEQRERLQTLASDLRTQAVRAWSVAATQLDVIAVEAGHGHVHIYLPASPESEALAPDSAPEGTGARGKEEE